MSHVSPKSGDKLRRREIPALPEPTSMRSVPAWALSCLLHVGLLIALSLLWTASPKGTGAEADRPVGVAVVYETAAGEAYFLGEGSTGAAESAQPLSAEELNSSLPATTSSTGAGSALLDELLPQAEGASGGEAGAAGELGLAGGGAPVGNSRSIPKAKTTVFGIEGEGSRFLYVFDRSDSMNGYGGAPLRAAKRELIESLDSLSDSHQFQIILYNDSPLALGGLGPRGPQLLTGTQQSKDTARRFVRDTSAVGGTRHVDALRMGLAMGPDVVFFLTDADFPVPSTRELESLQAGASRAGATIHTIQFGAGPSRNSGGWIRQLAEATLGKYRYLDVTVLE